MSKPSVIFHSILPVLALLISLALYYYLDQLHYTGALTVSHALLSAPISLHNDGYGFTHIKASSKPDAFFAIGVAHARDRLFQLEMSRLLSQGRLSELLGAKALKVDKFMRSMGFYRQGVADRRKLLGAEAHRECNELLLKYTEGINYWASTHMLPVEFKIVGIKRFANWTVEDSFGYYRLMDYTMSGDNNMQVLNHLIHDVVGDDFYKLMYNCTLFDYPYFNESYVSKEYLKERNLLKENIEEIMKIPDITHKVTSIKQSKVEDIFFRNNIDNSQASNFWVVDGKHTKSGKPILSNDPHLDNQIPNVHYIIKLYINDEVIFGSFPTCVPFPIIGSNKHIAYGFTTDYRNRIDFVEEKLDNENIDKAKYYYIDEKQYPLKETVEEIKVKGKKEPYKHVVKSTKNGPLIELIPKELNNIGFDYQYKSEKPSVANALSVNLYAYRKPLSVAFFLNRMFAARKEDFIKDLEDYVGPPFSLGWATTEGEIGYTPITFFPDTKNMKQLFKKGYSSKEYNSDLINGIPRKDTPVLTNPEKGFIVTANSHVFDVSYKYYSTSFECPWRTHRISHLLNELINVRKDKFSVEESIRILGDTKDQLCVIMKPILVKKLKSKIKEDENVYKYVKLLDEFQCNFNKNETAATLYEVYVYKLAQHLLLRNDKNNITGFNSIEDTNIIVNNHLIYFTLFKIINESEHNESYLNYPKCKIFNINHNCDDYIAHIFKNIKKYINQYDLGEANEDNLKPWGKVNKHYQKHSLDKVEILRKIFAREIHTDGNKNTPKVARNDYNFDKGKNPFTSVHAANFKFINDLSDITRPYICLDNGNSGNIISQFYDNLMVRCEANRLIQIEDYRWRDDSECELIIKPK